MEISLIRHGKSELIENDSISCLEFQQWVEKYDNCGVTEEMTLPPETKEKVENAKLIVTSDLIRSIQSARLLNPEVNMISNPLYRETELPILSKDLIQIKLRPNIWAVVMRMLWVIGYSNECESLSKAKHRAKKASQQLIDFANEYKSIVLVGHGFFNLLIAKELQKSGWKGNRKTSGKHWDCTTYYFEK
ncbi:histidine phosphatase family protein [Sutcliffiella sp. NC1]|uniref:Histidine phosphatase family protein n=2 Tax=Bacillaceae TaxID=186817 RepID=A0A223KPC5_9BACI|nr:MULTISPECIES: histidine phosphatase family protein [Sutcliffiella]AST91183.1 histidine phosphatase family protein [Sutcliffiella cohnii]MED4018783.1 histidine phosphatase family protein [Sutcliffiella cohnii]WBL17546.1 histidine phosphatase family protein [Sutcliffiella sp. NC1]